MNHELFYTFPEQYTDDVDAWGREARYFRGLGEDAGESVLMTTTPSGAPSSPAGTGSWLDKLATSVSLVLPVAANVYAQKKFTQLNIERARQGLSPLSAQQYAATIPAAQVTVGPNEQAKTLMLYGAAALAGLVALRALKVI